MTRLGALTAVPEEVVEVRDLDDQQSWGIGQRVAGIRDVGLGRVVLQEDRGQIDPGPPTELLAAEIDFLQPLEQDQVGWIVAQLGGTRSPGPTPTASHASEPGRRAPAASGGRKR